MIKNNISSQKTKNRTTFSWNNEADFLQLKNSIRNNKVCITSTDTILGFTANITKNAFETLNIIKGNRNEKPYLILISSPEKLPLFINQEKLDPKITNLINKCWPGPVTIIFKAREGLPTFLTSKDNKIALRCPKNKHLQKLLDSFDGLFSTSANKAMEHPPKTLDDINPEIIEKVECIITDDKAINDQTIDESSSSLPNLPSTIIDVSDNNEIKVLREGAYSIKELEDYYGEKFERTKK